MLPPPFWFYEGAFCGQWQQTTPCRSKAEPAVRHDCRLPARSRTSRTRVCVFAPSSLVACKILQATFRKPPRGPFRQRGAWALPSIGSPKCLQPGLGLGCRLRLCLRLGLWLLRCFGGAGGAKPNRTSEATVILDPSLFGNVRLSRLPTRKRHDCISAHDNKSNSEE